jgi:CheY-like chemotaxis protein/HPt (histidine-containing phosphotransfer) domain-containing protein
VATENRTTRRVIADYLREWGAKPDLVEPREAEGELRRTAAEGNPYLVAILEFFGAVGNEQGVLDWSQSQPPLCLKFVTLTCPNRTQPKVALPPGSVTQELTKPVKSADLLRAVTAVLRTSGVIPSAQTVAPPPPAPHALRVLVAEDNPVNQMVISRLLERDGHSVVMANHGGEAVEAYEREPFDLILMDVQMPEVDGFEATRMIRERQAAVGRTTPIVAMTAHAMKGDRERCLETGMDDYLPKPIPLDDLARVLAWASDLACQKQPPTEVPIVTLSPQHDFSTALARLGGDRKLFCELAELFQSELPQILSDLRRTAAAEDAVTFRRVIHSLKGSSGYVGGSEVSAISLEMETLAANGDVTEAFNHLPRLEKALDRLLKSLTEFRSKSDDGSKSRR